MSSCSDTRGGFAMLGKAFVNPSKRQCELDGSQLESMLQGPDDNGTPLVRPSVEHDVGGALSYEHDLLECRYLAVVDRLLPAIDALSRARYDFDDETRLIDELSCGIPGLATCHPDVRTIDDVVVAAFELHLGLASIGSAGASAKMGANVRDEVSHHE